MSGKYDMKVTANVNGSIWIDSETLSGKITFLPASIHGTVGKAVGLVRKFIDDNKMCSELSGNKFTVELVLNLTPESLESKTLEQLRLACKKCGFDVRFASKGYDLLINGSKSLADVLGTKISKKV